MKTLKNQSTKDLMEPINKPVVLEIPHEKFQFMNKKLDAFQDTIRMLKLNDAFKQSLNKDICIVKSILRTTQKIGGAT